MLEHVISDLHYTNTGSDQPVTLTSWHGCRILGNPRQGCTLDKLGLVPLCTVSGWVVIQSVLPRKRPSPSQVKVTSWWSSEIRSHLYLIHHNDRETCFCPPESFTSSLVFTVFFMLSKATVPYKPIILHYQYFSKSLAIFWNSQRKYTCTLCLYLHQWFSHQMYPHLLYS